MNFTSCDLACLVATGLFGGKLYLIINYNKKQLLDNFINELNDNQKKRYQKIIKERLNIYIQGMLIGLILGFIYLQIVPQSDVFRACMFTVIVLGTNYFYYILKPKSDYMVKHLTTKRQRETWLDIYREMQFRCKMGFVLGVLAFLIYGLAL